MLPFDIARVWRLPSDADWEGLVNIFGGANHGKTVDNGQSAYRALFVNGRSGFNAQHGGYRFPDGRFDGARTSCGYWTSTPVGNNQAWYYYFRLDNKKLERHSVGSRSFGRSVRCVKD